MEFDPAKSRRNAEERGMAFETAEDFEFETAIVREDTRKAYPEPPSRASGSSARRSVSSCSRRSRTASG